MRRVTGTRKNQYSLSKKSRVPKHVASDVDYAWNGTKGEFVPVSKKFGYATSLKNWISKKKPIQAATRRRQRQHGGSRRSRNAPYTGSVARRAKQHGGSRRSRNAPYTGSVVRRAKQHGGHWGLADFLPTTVWGSWQTTPGALSTGNSSVLPPPLANGGMFTGPQSTGPWASTPFPSTQWAHQLQATASSGLPSVFTHQRPNDNTGASWSPSFG
jgi:hypothetical protein